uniref:Protein kinase C-binding protein 1 n=1 Tax=Bracon brevicornis TaxID=1563983 RepID=A0A6V7MEY5_9HYME
MESSDTESQTTRRPKTPVVISRKNSSENLEHTQAPMPLRPKTPINYRKLAQIGLDSDSDEALSIQKTPKRSTKKRKNSSSSSSETVETDAPSNRPKILKSGKKIIQENVEGSNGTRSRPSTPDSPEFVYNQANGEVRVITPGSSTNSITKETIPNRPKTPSVPSRSKTPIAIRPKPINQKVTKSRKSVGDTPNRSESMIIKSTPSVVMKSTSSPTILRSPSSSSISKSPPIPNITQAIPSPITIKSSQTIQQQSSPLTTLKQIPTPTLKQTVPLLFTGPPSMIIKKVTPPPSPAANQVQNTSSAIRQLLPTPPLILLPGVTARMSTSRPTIANKLNNALNSTQKQPEVELIPRPANEQQKSLQKPQEDDAVTITPFSRSQVNLDTAAGISQPSTSKQTEVIVKKSEKNRRKSEIVKRNFDDDIEKIIEEDEENNLIPKNEVKKQNLEHVDKKKDNVIEEKEKEMPVEKKEKKEPEEKRRKTRDEYCWKCHKATNDMPCNACPRVFHRKCIGKSLSAPVIPHWVCGECTTVLRADSVSTRSPLMANISVDQLCMALKYIVGKMEACQGSEPFRVPVDTDDVPDYLDYVIKPMDLSLLKHYVVSKTYGSSEAFMNDAKWILHNCIVFNTSGGTHRDTTRLSTIAKQLIKTAREEVSEFECCPMCYLKGRHLPRMNYTWFNDACNPPHMLVWAKLKGFPYWPAKLMPRTNHQGYIDVKFFGEHNRAWVQPKDIYLFSKDPPASYPKSKQHDMQDSLREIDIHIRRLGETFGKFTYAEPKTLFDPDNPKQIKLLLPEYDPPENIYFMMKNVATLPIKKKGKSSETASDTRSERTVDSDNGGSDEEIDIETYTAESPKSRRGGHRGVRGMRGIRGAVECRRTGKIINVPPLVRMRGGIRGVGRGRGNWGPRSKKSVALKSTSVALQRIVVPRPGRNCPELKPLRTTRSIAKDIDRECEKFDEPITSEVSSEEKISIEPRRDRARKSFPNKTPPNAPTTSKNDEDQKPVDPKVTYNLPAADAGPLSSLLSRGANDLAKQMAMIMQESVKQAMENSGPLSASIDAHQAHIYSLKLEIERMKWTHMQDIAEVKHNAEKAVSEMRSSFECEHKRVLAEVLAVAEAEKHRVMRETKMKTWCVVCYKEAQLWCCLSVSYCSDECQMKHWLKHQNSCTRQCSLMKLSDSDERKINGKKEKNEQMPNLSTAGSSSSSSSNNNPSSQGA